MFLLYCETLYWEGEDIIYSTILKVKDSEVQELKQNMTLLEDKLNDLYRQMKRNNNKEDNKEQ